MLLIKAAFILNTILIFDLCDFRSDISLYSLFSAVYQQLQEYEQKIFGSVENNSSLPSFSFGFSRANDPPTPVPAFNNTGGTSIFSCPPFDIPPQEFTFGAGQTQKSTQDDSTFDANTNIPAVNDITMDGSQLVDFQS